MRENERINQAILSDLLARTSGTAETLSFVDSNTARNWRKHLLHCDLEFQSACGCLQKK